ncbi:MAG: hypothetical protein JST12_00780 [Armatimonadetes bacterium]|nr:hypothetical protein [Armatimonadota bacterium]
MSRARSPLFYFNFVCVWLFVASALIWNDLKHATNIQPLFKDYIPGTIVFAEVAMAISLAVGLVLAFIEWRIWRGWEPHWLETMKPGCEIISFAPKPGEGAVVFVQFPNGQQETYLADGEELPELELGMTCHLWVIGQHISRLRVIDQKKDLSYLQRLRLDPKLTAHQSFLASLLITCASAACVGMGASTVLTGHTLMSVERYHSVLETPRTVSVDGGDAVAFGLIGLVLGLAFSFLIALLWRQGWKTSDANFSTPDQADYQKLWN